jgi:hypothetical protein
MNRKTLIVCAFEPEADLLIREGFNVLVGGIGFLRNALTLQDYLLKNPAINEIIFIGSAGIYPTGRLRPYTENDIRFCHSNLYTNTELSVTEGRAKAPDIILERCETISGPIAEKVKAALSSENAVINSVQSITLDLIIPAKNETVSVADAENMEVYGTAFVSKMFNKNFTSFLALTNNVCSDGSQQWQKSHKKLSEYLQSELIRLLKL